MDYSRDRLEDFRKPWAMRRSKGQMVDTSRKLLRNSAPPDIVSARAKSQRHGKVTADHWNQ
jgi:hypothetical protein